MIVKARDMSFLVVLFCFVLFFGLVLFFVCLILFFFCLFCFVFVICLFFYFSVYFFSGSENVRRRARVKMRMVLNTTGKLSVDDLKT